MKKDKETKIEKENIDQNEKKEKVSKKNKEEKQEKTNKFIEIIKKKWLIDSSKTILLILIILAFFVGVTILMQNLELTPIDFTDEKLFTLTEESKEQVKNIDRNINIYFIGYPEEDSTLDLAKQYTKVNDKIKIEAVTASDRPDLVEKYGIETNSQGIIVECGQQYKVLASSDLYTYDYTTYESISVAEEKLTASIKSVVADKLPKVYFLNGYSSISLNNGMQYLSMYLQNEVNEIKTLNILSEGKVPEDCDTLVITTPEQDFDDIATNAINDYINKGGNILWLNGAIVQNKELTNVNKILSNYGVNPFEVGIIRETDNSKMVSGSPDLIIPEIQYSEMTSKLSNSEGVIFINATKINIVDDEALENLNVSKTELVKTSENAYFRTNFSNTSEVLQNGEGKTEFLVGAELVKTISEKNEETGTNEVKSTLVIYGENYFVTDYQLTQTTYTPMIAYAKNKDLVLNSIAYLTNREEDITVRKSTGAITYTATELENRIILGIIIAVPIIIITVGVVVWINRRRKK